MTTSDWQNPTLPVADRVELLLAEMTLEEKVAQLGSRWAGNDMQDSATAAPGESELIVAPMQDVFAASGSLYWRTPAGPASATSPGSSAATRSPRPRAPTR